MGLERSSSRPEAVAQILAAEQGGRTDACITYRIPVNEKWRNVFFSLPDEPIMLPDLESGSVFKIISRTVILELGRLAGRTHNKEFSELNTPEIVRANERRVFDALGVTSMRELIEDRNARMVSVALGRTAEDEVMHSVYATHRFAPEGYEPLFREPVKPVAELLNVNPDTLGAALNFAFIESSRPIEHTLV